MLDYRRFKEINDLYASGESEKARHLLMEMQSRCIALRDEMSMLKVRLQSIEDVLYISKNLYEENGFYWLKTGAVRQGPFCPECYAREGGLIRLEKDRNNLKCSYCHFRYASDSANFGTASSRHARILPFAR